jgi:hypothetical protein
MGKASWSNSNEWLDHDQRGGDPTSPGAQETIRCDFVFVPLLFHRHSLIRA